MEVRQFDTGDFGWDRELAGCIPIHLVYTASSGVNGGVKYGVLVPFLTVPMSALKAGTSYSLTDGNGPFRNVVYL